MQKKEATKIPKEKIVKIEINNSLIEFQQKIIYTYYYLNYTQKLNLLKNIALSNKNVQNSFNEIDKKSNQEHQLINLEKKLNDSDKTIDDIQNILGFKELYQSFEEFIFDLFLILFNNYPQFLKKIQVELDYDLIFNQDNIENIRSIIIEKRIKSYIQSNNIIKTLEKFESIFGVKNNFSKERMNEIYLASRIRNVLTHNNGKINQILLTELKTVGIKHNYKLNDSVYNSLKNSIGNFESLTAYFREKLTKNIINELPRISNHAKSMSEN